MSDSPIIVLHDPSPEVSSTPRMLARLLGHRPPIIRAGTLRKPLDGQALRQEIEKLPGARVVIARSAMLVGRDPAAGLVSCVAIAHPVVTVLRSFERLAASRIKREGGEATPEAVDARLKEILTEAKSSYPNGSAQAGLFSATDEAPPRGKPIPARDAATVASTIEQKAMVLFADFPAALTRGLRMVGEAAHLEWPEDAIARAARATMIRNLRKTLRTWRGRVGPELFNKVCDMNRGDLALLTHLFTDWAGKSGVPAEDTAAIEQSLTESGKVTAARKAAAAAPTKKAA
jgi:hypothetical protein